MAYKTYKESGKLILRCSQPLLLLALTVTLAIVAYKYHGMSANPNAGMDLAACGIFFFLILLCLQDSIYTFDLVNQRLLCNRFGPFLKRRRSTIDFKDIEAITMDDKMLNDGSALSRILIKADGKTMPLSNTFEGIEMIEKCFIDVHEAVKNQTPEIPKRERPRLQKISHETKKEVQLSENSLKSIDELIIQKRLIEAIKLVRREANVDLKDAKDFVDRRGKGL